MTDEAWIDTVRLARDFGTVSELFPDGFDDIRDLPYPLFDAINRAVVFIGFDELREDERPPKRIWLNGEALNEHFDWIKRKREAEMKGNDVEDARENEAAKALIVG